MEIVLPIILFVLGLALLIKGGDWFVDGSVNVARRSHIPEILIGATIVSIGTTLPEVMVSSLSAANGMGATAYGNAIGSIICNAALISAVTIAIRPVAVDRDTFRTPVIFFFAAAIFYVCISYFGTFARWVGIVLLAAFLLYMAVSIRGAFRSAEENKEPEDRGKPSGALWKDILLLVVGAGCIAGGAYLLVDNGKKIALFFGVPETVIAITFIALGTSLPELVTAIVSLVKGHSSLSLGNIIGANLFNLVLVSGMAITISPFDISEATAAEAKTLLGHPSSLVVEIPLMLGCMLILTVPTLVKGKVHRWQGILLLLLYGGFCVYQFAF